MNKKAVGQDVIIGLIIFVIVFFLLFLATKQIMDITGKAGGKEACKTSAVLSSTTRMFGTEMLKLDCPMELDKIKYTDLSSGMDKAQKEIKDYDTTHTGEDNGLNYFKGVSLTSNPEKLKEWALYSKIGTGMADCWGKLGEGKLNLFNAWYNPVYWEGKKDNELPWVQFFPKAKAPPTTCVICARIDFDDKIKEELKETTNFNEWAAKNAVTGQHGLSYYEYLIDEIHDKDLFTPNWKFTTDEPIAIVFARMNPQYVGNKFTDFLKFTGIAENIGKESIDALYLAKYAEVNNYCDYLANKPPEGYEGGKII